MTRRHTSGQCDLDSVSTLPTVTASLARIQSLRHHRDPDFAIAVTTLQRWRVERMEQCYTQLVDLPSQRALLQYYLEHIHGGLDVSEVRDIDSAVAVVDRFFSDTALLRAALEFTALAGEVAESLTASLELDLGREVIVESAFAQACCSGDLTLKMRRQIVLIEFFFTLLADLLTDRKLRLGLKLAKVPAHLYGVGNFHSLITTGFDVLKRCPDLDGVVDLFVRQEQAVVSRIETCQPPLFAPLQEA